MPYDSLRGSAEENVLTMLVWSEQHCNELCLRLKPDIFSTRSYRDIAEEAMAYIERFGKPPKAHIADLLENKIRKSESGRMLLDTCLAMEKLQETLHPEYVLAELDRFIALRTMSMAVEAAADALHAGDLEVAQEALDSNQPVAKHTEGTWLSDPEQSLRFMDKREDDVFSSGVDVFDSMHITPQRKTMMLMIAPAKRGKSWWLVECGKRNMMAGKSVLHVTLEMSEEKVSQRYVQAVFGLKKKEGASIRVPIFYREGEGDRFNRGGKFTSIEDENIDVGHIGDGTRATIAKKLRQLKSRKPILIKEFPTGSLTIAQLNNYLDMLKRVKNFVPDVLIVDYPDLMSVDPRDKRGSLGTIFVKLRGIAVARNMAVVAVTQGNRESDTARLVGMNMVAEDWSKAATADIVLTYNQTQAERKRGLARLYAAAIREEESGFLVLISQSYANGQFCLDSVYMDHVVEEEATRFSEEDNMT